MPPAFGRHPAVVCNADGEKTTTTNMTWFSRQRRPTDGRKTKPVDASQKRRKDGNGKCSQRRARKRTTGMGSERENREQRCGWGGRDGGGRQRSALQSSTDCPVNTCDTKIALGASSWLLFLYYRVRSPLPPYKPCCSVCDFPQCNEELEIVLTRLEAEATQAREASRAAAQRVAAATGAVRARELTGAQELETKAMERCAEGVLTIKALVRSRGEG